MKNPVKKLTIALAFIAVAFLYLGCNVSSTISSVGPYDLYGAWHARLFTAAGVPVDVYLRFTDKEITIYEVVTTTPTEIVPGTSATAEATTYVVPKPRDVPNGYTYSNLIVTVGISTPLTLTFSDTGMSFSTTIPDALLESFTSDQDATFAKWYDDPVPEYKILHGRWSNGSSTYAFTQNEIWIDGGTAVDLTKLTPWGDFVIVYYDTDSKWIRFGFREKDDDDNTFIAVSEKGSDATEFSAVSNKGWNGEGKWFSWTNLP